MFAIYNLCTYPEYLEPLRHEAERLFKSGDSSALDDMPLWESFLKETARLNPIDSGQFLSIAFYDLSSHGVLLQYLCDEKPVFHIPFLMAHMYRPAVGCASHRAR